MHESVLAQLWLGWPLGYLDIFPYWLHKDHKFKWLQRPAKMDIDVKGGLQTAAMLGHVAEPPTYLWLAGNEGMQKKRASTIMGYT